MTDNNEDILKFAEEGNIFGVEKCILSGISIDACDLYGRTSLHIAAAKNDTLLMDYLITHGANINSECIDGWTPLCEAAKFSAIDAFQMLLDNGTNLYYPKKWSVYHAALRGEANIKIFDILLTCMLDKRVPDSDMVLICDWAYERKRHDILKLFAVMNPVFFENENFNREPEPEKVLIFQTPIIVDVRNSKQRLHAQLMVGRYYKMLCEGGPFGSYKDYVEILYDSEILINHEIDRCGVDFPYYDIIWEARHTFWEAGYFPRLAIFHHKLFVTGLSYPDGGWINGRPYKFLDRLITLPANGKPILNYSIYSKYDDDEDDKSMNCDHKLTILPCIDSEEMALCRKKELDMTRDLAISLGLSALDACRQGFYITPKGQNITWRESVKNACTSKLSIDPDFILPQPKHINTFSETTVQICNETTLKAAFRLVQRDLKPIALNFANGIHPGGGFLHGARAQEEVLCRSSALYMTLEGDPMYEAHRKRPLPDSSNWAIYSPNVPIFRLDDGTELDQIWHLSFLTCAAPYAPAIGKEDSAKLLQERIHRVLEIMEAYEYDTLILGAWGCGAFGNDAYQTAKYFKQMLENDYKGVFSNVIFAITDWSQDRKFLGPFRDAFNESK
jgi:uncharacterized protein (TIGR02452 family)